MIIELKDLSRRFKNNGKLRPALDSLNLNIEVSNEIVAFIGPNGAGKTTLFKIMAGLLLPTSGSISVSDETSFPRWAKDHVALIPAGDRGLYSRNTVFENAMYRAVINGVNPKTAKASITDISAQLNMEILLSRTVETLSSGERKKAGILSGLCTEALLLLIDEPSLGLDIHAVLSLQEYLQKICMEKQKTLFIATHDVDFITGIASKYIFMKEGNVREFIDGAMNDKEFFQRYQEIYEGEKPC